MTQKYTRVRIKVELDIIDEKSVRDAAGKVLLDHGWLGEGEDYDSWRNNPNVTIANCIKVLLGVFTEVPNLYIVKESVKVKD